MIKFSLLLLFVSSSFLSFSQDRTSLENERMRIISKIEFTSNILKKTEKDKFATLDYLKSLQNQIKNRKKIIRNLKIQIQKINKETKLKQENYQVLIIRKNKIQGNFSRILTANYLQIIIKNKFLFLISSSNWENFLDRKRYLKQFNQYTKKRLRQINKQEEKIEKLLKEIEEDKNSIEIFLTEEAENIKKLKEDSNKKNITLRKLKRNEQNLLSSLKKQKRQREKLNNSIEQVILLQLSTSETANSNKIIHNTTSSFEENISKFDWPVSGGYISSRFGKHSHPSIKGVYMFNDGVDIRTSPNTIVKAIFDGEVVGLMHVSGYNWMIIIKHGNYYTVYSKLANTEISKGDKVTKGQLLGRIGESGIFHFQIWKQKTKLNPENWLTK